MDPAGVPTMRNDVSVPTVPNFGCKADLDNLGMDTDAATIVNPSIYTSYGLTFFDFFQVLLLSILIHYLHFYTILELLNVITHFSLVQKMKFARFLKQ